MTSQKINEITPFQVRDPRRFHFNPKFLLTKIVQIYLHFHREPAFIQEVVKDVRSFDIKVFHQATKFVRRENLLSQVCSTFA